MTKVIAFLLIFVSFSCFSANNDISQFINTGNTGNGWCKGAPPVTDANFCPAFKLSAQCHCHEDGGLPKEMCDNMSMTVIYNRMIAMFKSQKKACEYQVDHSVPDTTTFQECMDDWDCYNLGGYHGGICSEHSKENAGKKCP